MNYSILFECYIVLFYKHNYDDISSLNKKYNLDEVYDYVYSFWLENNDEKLDLQKEDSKEKLYNYLNNIFRYKVLNDLLQDLYECITDDMKDSFLINNINTITNIVDKSINNNFTYNKEREIPDLSKDDLNKYFKEFLSVLDPSLDFLKVYEDLLNNKKIIYWDFLDKEEKEYLKKILNIDDDNYNSFNLRENDNETYIILNREGKLNDFITLTHEFIHYYIYNNMKERPYYLIEEFPSILYEYFATRFLSSKGYDKEDINNLYAFRFIDNNKKKDYLTIMNYYFKLFINNNLNVFEECDEEKVKEIITDFIEKKGFQKYKELLDSNEIYSNPKKLANYRCDYINKNLMINPYYLVNNYPYLIGHYLSLEYINSINNGKITIKELNNMIKNNSINNIEKVFDFINGKDDNKSL